MLSKDILVFSFIIICGLLLVNRAGIVPVSTQFAWGSSSINTNTSTNSNNNNDVSIHTNHNDISVVHHNNNNNNNNDRFSMGLDGFIRIPGSPTIPFNQGSIISRNAIAGSGIPKNLIVGPSCQTSCPPIIGTQRDDIIYAATVTDALVYALNGDDIVLLGTGNPQAYGGNGDDILVGGSGNAQLYGGQGDDIMIGGFGNNLLVGGPGNDQLYAGPGHDILIGGHGADFFDCGSSGNSVIADFNPSDGDIKAGNCKFVVALSSPSQ